MIQHSFTWKLEVPFFKESYENDNSKVLSQTNSRYWLVDRCLIYKKTFHDMYIVTVPFHRMSVLRHLTVDIYKNH